MSEKKPPAKPAKSPKPPKPAKIPEPSGVSSIDSLAAQSSVSMTEYLAGASAYVVQSPSLDEEQKKRAQIRLGVALARVIAAELQAKHPALNITVGEVDVAGALRTAQSDVTDMTPTDGVRLAIEIKPVYLAVGRAIWNRFGDIRAFAVNIHLKFPFAVVGGIMPIPIFEWDKNGTQKSTRHLIDRLIRRFVQVARRVRDGDPPHSIESVCVLVFDPNTGKLVSGLPPSGSGLTFPEFISTLAELFDGRFVY